MLDFDTGEAHGLKLLLEAREAKGGSIAGALGYSPNQPFTVDVRATGEAAHGSFHAAASSGALTPLRADGGWTKDGGRAQGVIAFAGSRPASSPSHGRVGHLPGGVRPRAFERRPDGRFLRRTGRSPPRTSSARGQGAVEAQPLGSASGMRVVAVHPLRDAPASAASSSNAPASTGPGPERRRIGASRASSPPSGRAWTAISDGEPVGACGGHASARVDTMAKMRRRKALGGEGKSLVASLLGARPKAQVSASRLADGRIILQQLDLDGANLVVRGKGARGLVGGYAFEGRAEIPRLSAVHPGGRGGLSATWRAADAGPGRPWTLGFTADGKDFASGLGQLDRLLGPSPRLKANGQLMHGVVKVETAALTGQAGEARGVRSSVGLAGALDLKIDWTARGPFEAGPATIAGDARGSGQRDRKAGRAQGRAGRRASSASSCRTLPLQHALGSI